MGKKIGRRVRRRSADREFRQGPPLTLLRRNRNLKRGSTAILNTTTSHALPEGYTVTFTPLLLYDDL